jgi:hypothetical protein
MAALRMEGLDDYSRVVVPMILAQINAGLGYAAAILGDQIGVLSYYSRGKFSGSRSVDLPSPETLPKLYEGMGFVGKLEVFFGTGSG